MIISKGVVQFTPSSLICFQSPKIQIVEYVSSIKNDSIINIGINLTTEDSQENLTINIPFANKKIVEIALASSIGIEVFILNTYFILEQILLKYLQMLNPECTFEIAQDKELKIQIPKTKHLKNIK